jgi:hypothetical protein
MANTELQQARDALAKSFEMTLEVLEKSVGPAKWNNAAALDQELQDYESAFEENDRVREATGDGIPELLRRTKAEIERKTRR